MPKNVPLAFPDLRPLIEASKVEILQIAGECDSLDLLSAAHIQDMKQVKTITLTGVGHGGAPFIKEHYGLSEFIALWADDQPLPEIIEAGASVSNGPLVRALYKTFLAFQEKDWPKVELEAAVALKLDPRHEYSNYLLGTSLLEVKRIEEALAPLLMSVGSAPHYMGARYRLGRALMLNKRHGYAKVHFMAYLKRNPAAHTVLMMLSDIYAREGNLQMARQYLLGALEHGGDAEKIEPRLARLAA